MHYICTGGCGGTSGQPGTCQAATCPKHGQPLQACDCKDGHHARATVTQDHVDTLKVGLAVGVALAVYTFAMGLIAMVSGRGYGIVAVLRVWDWGFGPTLTGSLIGAIWGFFDGFLVGILAASLFHYFKKSIK